MRWLFLFLVAAVGVELPIAATTFAESTNPVEIASISHAVEAEAKESITFKLGGPATPKVFSMKGDNPRLIIDLPGSIYRGNNVMPLTDGKLATAIRIGLHRTPEQKTRVVVDLAKDSAVQFTHEYSDADNSLRVELTAGSTGLPPKDLLPVGQPLSPKAQHGVEVVAAKPPGEPPAPPLATDKAKTAKPAAKDVPAGSAVTPQLLDISFDDSSDKGEMVLFHLNDFHPPAVSAVEKDRPRVLCEFTAMGLGKAIQKTILANGKYVENIHTKKLNNPDRVQVVLELTPDRDYDLQQVFFKNDNLFVLIVNELPPEKAGK